MQRFFEKLGQLRQGPSGQKAKKGQIQDQIARAPLEQQDKKEDAQNRTAQKRDKGKGIRLRRPLPGPEEGGDGQAQDKKPEALGGVAINRKSAAVCVEKLL